MAGLVTRGGGEPFRTLTLVLSSSIDVRTFKDPPHILILGLITEGRFSPQRVAGDLTWTSLVVGMYSSTLGVALHRDITFRPV
eukprot:9403164-Pyramimonas_sp.AAC.1